MRLTKDEWANGWACINIEPGDGKLFLPILIHLAHAFEFPLPQIMDILDGYAAECEIQKSRAILHMDNWSFSMAFENSDVRDQVLANLEALPDLHFGA